MGQHETATKHYTDAIDIRDDAYHRIPRAMEYANHGRCAEATVDAETALAMDPYSEPGYHTSAEAHWILAACLGDEQAQTHTNQATAIAQAHGYTPEDTTVASEAVDRWRTVKKIGQPTANMEIRHHQWTIETFVADALTKANNGLAGGQSVNDGKDQRYSCAIYLDGTQIPRANLSFSKNLIYQVITNESGEHQGAINAITTVAGTTVPVEWRTWVTQVDTIRLRDANAAHLVHSINELNAEEFALELKDNPELSAKYDVSNLITALAANKMTCFQNQQQLG